MRDDIDTSFKATFVSPVEWLISDRSISYPVAVAAILLADAHHLTASSPALDLGFVLSGFLVTARLLAEHRATGSISIGRWFGRRARRLLPALFLLLVGAVLSEPVWGSAIGRHDLRGDAFAALAGVSNWRTIAAGRPGTISPAASPLEHLWSLAVMAQFLLVWPLATIGVVVVIVASVLISAMKAIFSVALLHYVENGAVIGPFDTDQLQSAVRVTQSA